MKVSELKVGELYKIRSDRKTHVIVGAMLDIHVGHGYFEEGAKIRPREHLLYLGGRSGNRWVMYKGKKLAVYPNAWQHIVPIGDDIS